MKIAVLTMTRTRSSYLLDILAKHYQITNLYEKYKDINPDQFKKKCIGISSKEVWERYKTQTVTLTNQIFLENQSFVVKIFPITVLNYFSNLSGYSKDDFLDLVRYYRLDEYDKVFILTRNNITDLACSHIYAMQTQFLFAKDEVAKIDYYNPSRKKKVFLSNQNLKYFQSRIDQHLFLEHIHLYLDRQQIPYTKLDYGSVKDYVGTHCPNIESDIIESKYDYAAHLSNYEEIKKEVELLYKEREHITNWKDLFL